MRSPILRQRHLVASLFILLPLLVYSTSAPAENAFDLIGPKVQVRVQRSGMTLPIAEVPNLQAGDRLWIHPDLPDSQSVRYLMVVAFLRGSTNPPPESWFTRVETWSRPLHNEGVYVVVPTEAEEALIFFAPETGGAFSTLRTAVRGKPGAFVRAAQDLEQASLDRARLERYLESVRDVSSNDPDQLKSRTTLLARSLNIRLDQQCFDKPSAQQAPCLTQHTDELVLDDAHSQTMVATLTSGAQSDLLAQISSTPNARSGYYNPYIGAVVDVVRILNTTHTAQFQYIPALALPTNEDLNLRLNNPPSFRNPKSVLVVGLPPIRPVPAPPLRAVDGTQVYCAGKPTLLLPADGAPLVFATDLAYNFMLRVDAQGSPIDVPAKVDPLRGGFVVETQPLQLADLHGEVNAILHGMWGFHSFDGPRYRLRASRPARWIVASKDASALILGRDDTLHLQSADACCVSEVTVKDDHGRSFETTWKLSKPDELEVKVPLENANAGAVTMFIRKFSLAAPDEIPLHTYAEAGRLDSFSIHAGDAAGVLKGTRLDQVSSLKVSSIEFAPDALTRANQQDELVLTSRDLEASNKLHAGDSILVRVTLKDGRALDLKTEVDAPRPKVSLLTKSVQYDQTGSTPTVRLGSLEELPQDGRLNFFLKTQEPAVFPPSEKIEVATSDESFRVFLSFNDGNLTLQDSKTVFAVLDPMKLLGPSAFGPLKFRAVAANGIEGDWQPLVNLVRIPKLDGIRCIPGPEKQCTLNGEKLFLLDSVSADPDFDNAVTVPEGFVQDALAIPSPKAKTLYIKLRDDPETVDVAVLPLLPNAQQ